MASGIGSASIPVRRFGVVIGRPDSLTAAGIGLLAFRWLVVGCQAATILITWSLWQVHRSPPMLPALSLPAIPLGVLLLCSLALVLVVPLPGAILHTALLVYAMLIDQTRMQPEVISLAFLLWGTLPFPTAKTFGRAHLVSLWFFAGLNKLLSPAFIHGTAQWMLAGLVSHPPAWLQSRVGYPLALTELSLGVLAFLPWTRKVAAVVALGLHLGILLDLSPKGHDWNQSVWPWNVALAFAGIALIAPWRGSPWRAVAECRRFVRPLVVLLVISPAGFYVGLTDAYLAHNLYSSNTATAVSSSLSPAATWDAFNVPLPPEHRLFAQYFRATCAPGDHMTITDTRWWYRRNGREQERLSCPDS
jgi:hypothetical protein